MKAEELESINSELFRALDVEDQQYVTGQSSRMFTDSMTFKPSGYDVAVTDYVVDWS